MLFDRVDNGAAIWAHDDASSLDSSRGDEVVLPFIGRFVTRSIANAVSDEHVSIRAAQHAALSAIQVRPPNAFEYLVDFRDLSSAHLKLPSPANNLSQQKMQKWYLQTSPSLSIVSGSVFGGLNSSAPGIFSSLPHRSQEIESAIRKPLVHRKTGK